MQRVKIGSWIVAALLILISISIVLSDVHHAEVAPYLRRDLQAESLNVLAKFAEVKMTPFIPGVPVQDDRRKALERYGKIPLGFELNQGQSDQQVKFIARGFGYNLFLTSSEAVMLFRTSNGEDSPIYRSAGSNGRNRADSKAVLLRVKLAEANPKTKVVGLDKLSGRTSYFKGNNRKHWLTNIPTFARVKYQNVYPGVDLVYYGRQGQLEYDFVIAPEGDPEAIRLVFEGANKIEVDPSGDLLIHIPGGSIRQRRPFIYQDINGLKEEVGGEFVINDNNEIGFRLAAYDTRRPLIIDPVIDYSTYLGGSGDDFGCGITLDAAGNAYITGWTFSVNFPTMPGAFQPDLSQESDAFVLKVNSQGDALIYSTFLGGSEEEFEVISVAVDPEGNAYVTGSTKSTDFPTTPGAFQTVYGGGNVDAFVLKLNPSGSGLVYSTFVGGSHLEGGQFIAVDGDGNAYVAGITGSKNFPTTPGAFQIANAGGPDAFVAKINPAGSGLVYSTYLGGSGNEGWAPGLAVDGDGNAYVTGSTDSTDFPTTPGAFQIANAGGRDAFVAKLNPAGSALVYSSYLGGGGADISRGFAMDVLGNVYVAGATYSPNFPTTLDAVQIAHAGGEDVFVTKVNPEGSVILYSTFLGGTGNDRARNIAVDMIGDVYMTGFTNSTNFPTANPIQPAYGGGVGDCFFRGGCDAFITKIAQIAPVAVRLSSTTTSVSRGEGLPFTVEISNQTDQTQGVAFVLILNLPTGQAFQLLPPQPVGLTPNASVTIQPTLSIPLDAPVGLWMLKGMIGQPMADGLDVANLNVLEFTVD